MNAPKTNDQNVKYKIELKRSVTNQPNNLIMDHNYNFLKIKANKNVNILDMDKDIQKPDPNIDFRRVANLTVYLKRNHQSLTIDLSKIEEWQPGDIVVFSNDRENHIAIVSDKRNEKGIPYIIHNAGQPNREEDGLEFYNEYAWPIVAHYRWTDYGI